MAAFNKAVLTVRGNNLLTGALNGDSIEFTRLETGDGTYDGTEDLSAMDRLRSKRQEFPFLRMEKDSDRSVMLVAMISNEGLETGYRMTEIGVFGKLRNSDEEVLCSVTTAVTGGADFWPSFNGMHPSKMVLRYHVTVSPDASPCIAVEDDTVLAEIAAESNRAHAAERELSERITESVAGALEDAKRYADSAYTQASGYTDGKIADLINGAPSTLDTLKEIADAMQENENVVEALETAVGSKASDVEFQDHADNRTVHVTRSEKEKWNGAERNAISGIKKNGQDILPDSERMVNIQVPAKMSELDNDAGYLTSKEVDPDEFKNIAEKTVEFEEAKDRANIKSGESFKILFGKISKIFRDLKNVAFSGSYNDLSNKPMIPTVPASLKNPHALSFNGAESGSYDGSAAKTVKIPSGTNSLLANVAGTWLDAIQGAALKRLHDDNASKITQINSDLSALKAYELFDYGLPNDGGDVHVYKCGKVLQYRIRAANVGNIAAYSEKHLYTFAGQWAPWVDLVKVPCLCDNPGDGDFYFTITADGKLLLGTRNKPVASTDSVQFNGWICGIAK